MSDDLRVTRWEENGEPHIQIEAHGFPAEELGKTCDNIESMREPPGKPLVEVLDDDE